MLSAQSMVAVIIIVNIQKVKEQKPSVISNEVALKRGLRIL